MSAEALNGSVRLAYEVHGEGSPVLLIHGWGYGLWGWEPVARPLAARYRVVAFDNRGVGGSDIPPGPYTVTDMAEDAVAVLDAAGLRTAHVIGTSLGGMIAQEVALDFPDRVDRLVLACTTPGGPGAYAMPRQTVRLLEEAQSLEPQVALRRFVANALAPGAPEELVERIYSYRQAQRPDPAGWHAQGAAGAGFDASERLGAIAAPTLVLHGTADGVVDPRNSELLAERIPDARLDWFEGCGHLFFWEQPDRFVEVVTEFLG
jgi:pimeloyl-ACP methyl ester carboxylesterase